MNVDEHSLRYATRRHFFNECGVGVGSLALAGLLGEGELSAGPSPQPLAPCDGHFPARAKSVIFLFMAGGPSQLELFTPKPKLNELSGQVIPESYVQGKRFAFLPQDATLLGCQRNFTRHGECGAHVSEALPHLAQIVDDVAIVTSMKTDVFNHGPAKLFVNTGSPQFSGRPSMGAWITYGIGSESESICPDSSCCNRVRAVRAAEPPCGAAASCRQLVSGRALPERKADPILNLSSPAGRRSPERQGDFVNCRQRSQPDALRLSATKDPEIATRIASYEMAYRMQTSCPRTDGPFRRDAGTLSTLYGVDPATSPLLPATACYARRLIEKGVRFVQLYHTDWDHHGNIGTELGQSLDDRCQEVDQPSAALVSDLKQRGLLEDTIVIWGGEFGRTPQGEDRKELRGRDHHIDAYTMWLAGGGIQGGQTIGQTDEIGYEVIEDPVHVHDLQATILHLLGLDHKRLTYRFQGRDFRLTDVHGM